MKFPGYRVLALLFVVVLVGAALPASGALIKSQKDLRLHGHVESTWRDSSTEEWLLAFVPSRIDLYRYVPNASHRPNEPHYTLKFVTETTTDEAGYFLTDPVMPGQYLLVITPNDLESFSQAEMLIPMPANFQVLIGTIEPGIVNLPVPHIGGGSPD